MTPPPRRGWWLAVLSILALALAASANSLVNGLTYDDVYAIVNDSRAHTLEGWWREFAGTYWAPRWGGDGYRPLTRIAFRLAWAAGEGSAMPFHALNVVLHLAGSVAVLWLASALLPFAAAWIAAALYAVHPVHTEAIANAVGLSELAVALCTVTACGIYAHARRRGSLDWRHWAGIGALYTTACLFKENAIVLPALLVLLEMLAVSDRAPLRTRLLQMRLPLLALTVVALAYLWARTSVVAGVSGFVPAVAFQTLNLSPQHRILTMVGAAPEWYRLLLWPARLSADYSPPYIDIAEGLSIIQVPGAILLLATLGLMAALWRRTPVAAFGIGWLVVTLLPASNFIIPAGLILAERTLLLPSVGVVITLGCAVPWLYERLETRPLARAGAALGLAALIALGLARSYTRNRVWYDNDRLFAQTVVDAPRSYRAHYLLANHLAAAGRPDVAEVHYREAFRLFPYDPLVPFMLAERYRATNRCPLAIPMYRWAFELAVSLRYRQLGLAGCLLDALELEEARAVALDAMRYGARVRTAREVVRAAEAGMDSLAARRRRATADTLRP